MSVPETVPFADLYAQYLTIKPEIDAAMAEVIRASAFIRGPFVDAFEREFSEILGVPHCVSCANGTDALYIAMHALGVKPGDEVITSAHSWIATSETITQAGGKVVFCDTDSDTFTIDPARIEEKISPRTVGIIPVHLYGQPADMPAIMAIAARRGLWVLEDCAQAHLARCGGRSAGSFGVAAAFSFYPGKNLGAMGDAGCVLTADSEMAERMAMFARHGGLKKGDHRMEGINSRLDGMQAAVLSVKLRRLPFWTAARRRLAAVYDKALDGLSGLELPEVSAGREHVYHLYVVRHPRRDELKKYLADRGIETIINYPVALPFLPAYSRLGARPGDFPNAYRHQSMVLSLPMFPEMAEAQQTRVIEAIRAFCK
ncbi:MAG TPA: erythromycin biosynthesis sensory transduction protein eryC1 [Elusimicrobia bacterium]|nr:erythromycin biosynthesis sensory transduction protein eryC1 [Elusimicrobiota bacterium]